MAKVDVDHSKYEGIRFDIENEDVILVHILETIPYEYVGKDTLVTIPTNEFTSVCPWSGLPDFADINISYVPNENLVEMKSLKYYLTSYRNVGIYQEHATNRMLEDLVNLLDPKELKITATWNARGGLGTEVVAEYKK
ncbi:preQ(1) synthase [Pseudalkalibacillus decolorationis]|uniref:preQ(1) synthase n=1 Tax=Pseudalkalibacillus decolorationis TaxID=163879 RepID=UPI00214938FD|nr:preQ(1) synthase [Pseudalkalibacillus decolorationis]